MLDASGKPGPSLLKGNNKFMGNYKQCNAIRHTDPGIIATDIQGQICRAYFTFKVGPLDFVSTTCVERITIVVSKQTQRRAAAGLSRHKSRGVIQY